MDQRLLRSAWLSALAAIIGAPVVLWFATAPAEPMWRRLSVITGLLALSALVCAAVLPSRIRSLNRAFGIESVVEVHRFLGVVSGVLVLAHLACVVAADPANVWLLTLPAGRPAPQAATAATVALLALIALALFRKRLGLGYELWRTTHVALAVAVLVFSALHVWFLDQLVRDPLMFPLLVILALVVGTVLAHRWAFRTLLDPSAEFIVREVRRENSTVSTLVLEPRPARDGGPKGTWAFAPGQFAWIRLERSAAEEHPFTIASSAHMETTEFTIRHAGDFTRAIRRLAPGSPVWVDGPHGAFTNDAGESAGYVLIAGGVGITPMMSMLRTAAHRDDTRPYRLLVVASKPEDLLFRHELADLRWQLDLEVTEVLRRPHDDWTGHTGDIDAGLLAMVRQDTEQPEDLDYFICGPPALVADALSALDTLAVPQARVHTEQFDLA